MAVTVAAGTKTSGNNNGRSPEHFVIEEIAVGDCSVGGTAVPCVSPTVLPLGSPVQTVSSWQNVAYDIYVPHYGNNIQNFRPTQLSVPITTTMNSSKIQIQTQFNVAFHGGSHDCRWPPAPPDCHVCLSGTVCRRRVLVVATESCEDAQAAKPATV